ncbi:MAG: hypothetical protein QNJ36_11790 [Calothrix sp. MO_167.B42]|nr:hypothetical protein [Calothrix sp. MO_167.B42]
MTKVKSEKYGILATFSLAEKVYLLLIHAFLYDMLVALNPFFQLAIERMENHSSCHKPLVNNLLNVNPGLFNPGFIF